MTKNCAVINSNKYYKHLVYGAFPFIIGKDYKYDSVFSLSDVYKYYIKLLYEE